MINEKHNLTTKITAIVLAAAFALANVAYGYDNHYCLRAVRGVEGGQPQDAAGARAGGGGAKGAATAGAEGAGYSVIEMLETIKQIAERAGYSELSGLADAIRSRLVELPPGVQTWALAGTSDLTRGLSQLIEQQDPDISSFLDLLKKLESHVSRFFDTLDDILRKAPRVKDTGIILLSADDSSGFVPASQEQLNIINSAFLRMKRASLEAYDDVLQHARVIVIVSSESKMMKARERLGLVFKDFLSGWTFISSGTVNPVMASASIVHENDHHRFLAEYNFEDLVSELGFRFPQEQASRITESLEPGFYIMEAHAHLTEIRFELALRPVFYNDFPIFSSYLQSSYSKPVIASLISDTNQTLTILESPVAQSVLTPKGRELVKELRAQLVDLEAKFAAAAGQPNTAGAAQDAGQARARGGEANEVSEVLSEAKGGVPSESRGTATAGADGSADASTKRGQAPFYSSFPSRRDILSGRIDGNFWLGGRESPIYKALAPKAEIVLENNNPDVAKEAFAACRDEQGVRDNDIVIILQINGDDIILVAGRFNACAVKLGVPGYYNDLPGESSLMFKQAIEINALRKSIEFRDLFIAESLRRAEIIWPLSQAQRRILERSFGGFSVRAVALHLYPLIDFAYHYNGNLDFASSTNGVVFAEGGQTTGPDGKVRYKNQTLNAMLELDLITDRQLSGAIAIGEVSTYSVGISNLYEALKENFEPSGNGSTLKGIVRHLLKKRRELGPEIFEVLFSKMITLTVTGEVLNSQHAFVGAPQQGRPVPGANGAAAAGEAGTTAAKQEPRRGAAECGM